MLDGLLNRNAHLPVGPSPADPGWGQRQAWGLDGDSPTVSIYDQPYPQEGDNLSERVTGGRVTVHELLPPSELTMTRAARVAAQQVSVPAARFFQSYTGSGTGQAMSPGVVASPPRRMSTASQRSSAWGSAELHPATTYDPFPSPASLYPKVV